MSEKQTSLIAERDEAALVGPYTVERYANRHDWLLARKRGLGSSDSAAALGMSRFHGPYSITQDKFSASISDDEGDETMEWGTRLEPAIAQKFAEVTGLTITDPGSFTIFRSRERPHLCCTPERLTSDDGVLELKTAHFGAGKEWAARIPLGYQVQLQHALYVTGRTQGYFAVLVDGYRWKYHPMKRHEGFLARMLPRLDAFWASIERGEYPNVDGSEATARALAARYPKPGDGVIELETDFQELGDEYDAILARGRADENRQLEIQNQIKAKLGDAIVGVLPDQSGFAWRANGKGRRFQRLKKVSDVG